MKSEDRTNQRKYITALSHSAALRVLIDLCKDDDLAKRIYEMSIEYLSDVDAYEIAEEVFGSLNAIAVEDLWDNSGKTCYGYREETEVAFEMVEDTVRYFTRKMDEYKALEMKKQEKEYCKGIIIGLLKYGEEGNNEFADWVPDDPYTIADNILYEWKQNNKDEDIDEVKAVYDSFFVEDRSELHLED